MKIPLISGPPGMQGKYPVNFYYDPERPNGRPAFVGTPGLIEHCDFGLDSKGIRGMHPFNNLIYAVCGNTVYTVNKNGNYSDLDTKLMTSSGQVWMANNGVQLMIVDGKYGYIVTGNTVARISDVDFRTPSGLAYQDTYFIIANKNTDSFYISESYDGTTWDLLETTAAEGNPDITVSIISDHRELFAFGEKTTEVYYNSGDATFTFERVDGRFIEKGCGAAKSPAKIDNSVYWLSDKDQVLRIAVAPEVMSTRHMESEIAGYSEISDAIGFAMVYEGQAQYWLTFPTEDVTWVYDIATKLWHKRSSGLDGGRHRANCYAFFDRKHFVGDWEESKIYYLSSSTYTDNTEPIKRVYTFPSIDSSKIVEGLDGHKVYHKRIQFDFKMGVGITAGQGVDPKVMLRWSDDDERTWSNEKWLTMGKIGEYGRSCIRRRLGRAYRRTYQIMITDPVECELAAAFLEAEIG